MRFVQLIEPSNADKYEQYCFQKYTNNPQLHYQNSRISDKVTAITEIDNYNLAVEMRTILCHTNTSTYTKGVQCLPDMSVLYLGGQSACQA